jgi:putative hydrolase of the HAD superfamily
VTIRHLLLDADDVLQEGAREFRSELLGLLGEDAGDWLRETDRPDGDVLTGRVEVVPLLADRLRVLGRHEDPQRLYERLWLEITPHPPVLDLVARWRRAGVGVHLATNQDAGRAAYMKQALGYDTVLDGGYYSSDLGVAKPAAAYFSTVLDDLGARPQEVAFVDDMAANVAGARSLGLAAVQWEIADGTDRLESRLAAVGLLT